MEKTKILLKDLSIDLQVFLLKLEFLKRTGHQFIWETKDGKEIPVNKMETSHLYNTIKYLNKVREYNEEMESIKDLLPSSIEEIL